MDVIEAMETCRAIRFYKPDPVPEELLQRVLHAATRAPSPGNTQGWDFIVVDDRRKLDVLADAFGSVMGPRIDAMPRPDRTTQLMLEGAKHLATKLGGAPVVIFACGPVLYPPGAPHERFTWSAIYPAAQNLLVAARSLGLGTAFTTLHAVAERTVREVLGIPPEILIGATIPLGWPDRPFGPVNRRPVSDFVHRNGYQGSLRGDAPAATSR